MSWSQAVKQMLLPKTITGVVLLPAPFLPRGIVVFCFGVHQGNDSNNYLVPNMSDKLSSSKLSVVLFLL